MIDKICCVDVGPALPENYIGNLTFPELVDAAENPYTGAVTFIIGKPYGVSGRGILTNYDGTAAAGVPTLAILARKYFFSRLYKPMQWQARNPVTYAPLYWRIGLELYDCLNVCFSPEVCDIQSIDVTYEEQKVICDPCAVETCP